MTSATERDANRMLFTHLFASRSASGREDGVGLVASLAAHTALIAILLWSAASPGGDSAAGAGIGVGLAGGGGGGGGGSEGTVEQLTFLTLVTDASPSAPEAADVPARPAVPPIELIVPEEPLEFLEEPSPAARRSAWPVESAGAGEGVGRGVGTGPGAGPGGGGGTGGGTGGGIGLGIGPGAGRGRVFTPDPEFISLPFAVPAAVRGRTAVVRFLVDSAGVVRDADLLTPTGDAGFDRLLRRTALGWRFRPARDLANRPMSALFDVSFQF